MLRTRASRLVPALLLVGLLASTAPARGQTRESSTVDTATIVFREIMGLPEEGIPPALLGGAQAIAIIPNVFKAGFLAGVRHGRGVLMVRTTDGSWSAPVFVTLTGGSFGFQAGVSSTDVILVFKNRRSLESFLNGRGKFTLGADAAVAAGPVGRQLEAGTDALLSSEIYSYSRSRGLFAGVSLEGAGLALDWRSNNVFYNDDAVSPTTLLGGVADVPMPKSAERLRGWLNYFTRPVKPLDPAADAPVIPDAPAVPAAPAQPAAPPADPDDPLAPTTLDPLTPAPVPDGSRPVAGPTARRPAPSAPFEFR